MTNFTDRERSFEAQFAHDAELQFRVMARRDKLLGLWIAAHLGLGADEAATYAKSVVQADLEEAGDEDVMRKVMADLAAAASPITEHEVRHALATQGIEARRQIMEAL